MKMKAMQVCGLVMCSVSAWAGPLPDTATLGQQSARFVPTALQADISDLPPGERQALARIVAAGRLMDAIYHRQVWGGNGALLLDLQRDGTPLGRARLSAFLLNAGPWTRLDGHAPFLPGVPEKPAAGTFYPAGAQKADIEAWLRGLGAKERDGALGFYSVIRRVPGGGFTVVPYSTEYQPELELAAGYLRDAAKLTEDASLRRFLTLRAEAFLSNDYRPSDVAWMQLSGRIEPTIGPYETYEDGWFGAKAAFESYVTLRDEVESKRLQRYAGMLQDIEDHLPEDPKLRNSKIGALAPIRVVNSIYCSGEGNRAVQTAAYNLPNDEGVTREMGTKRVMLKNVQEAKFRAVLLPIAKVALPQAEQRRMSFEAFFTHILFHELVHGLGPHQVQRPAAPSTPRRELEDAYSAIEEAKADIAGLFAVQYLLDRGSIPKAAPGAREGFSEEALYSTFLASAFRTLRFGLSEAHGQGMALQLNWLLDAGAVRVGPDGTFRVEPGKIKGAVEGLARELLTIEGEGDRKRAQALLSRLAVLRPEVQRVLDKLRAVPVDIAPRFPVADRLQAEWR